MSFYHRYELVRLIQNGEPKTFEAREIANGRPVLLHLWSMGEAGQKSELLLRIRDTMRTDPAALLGSVIEVQESAEPPYAVTVQQEDFPGLGPWLESRLRPAAAPAAPPPFQAPVQPPPFQPPAPRPSDVQPAPAPAPAPAQGEFTRMFGAPPPQQEAAPRQPEPVGEFTKLFGAQRPPVEPPPPPAPPAFQVAPPFGPPESPQAPPKPQPLPAAPAAQQPGEFTKLFGSPLGANPLPVEAIERGAMAPPPPPPSDRPFRGPSEFTIQFGHNAIEDGAPAPPPPPPPEFSKNLAATGLFSVPVPEQHHAPPPPQSTGPGEFTRIMMRPATFQPPSPPPAAAPAPPPPAPGTLASVPIQNQKTWLAPLIAVLTIVVVLLFIAVIVLLLKR